MKAKTNKTEIATGWSSERNKSLLQYIKLGLVPGFQKQADDLFRIDSASLPDAGFAKPARMDINKNVDSLRRQP